MTEIMNQMHKFQFSSKVSFPVYIYQPSGSLIDPTLLVGWLAMILMSLALSCTSAIPQQQSTKDDLLNFLIVTGEGHLIQFPLTSSFSPIKKSSW